MQTQPRERQAGVELRLREREGVAGGVQPRERRQAGVGVDLRERPGFAPSAPWVEERQRPMAQGTITEQRQSWATTAPGRAMPPSGPNPGYEVEAQGGGQPPAIQPQYRGGPAYRGQWGAGQPPYAVQTPQPGLSPDQEAARIEADRRFADQDDQGQAWQEQQQHQRWWNQQGRREEAQSRREWRRLQDLGWQAYGPTPPEYGPLPPGYEVAPQGPPGAQHYPAWVYPRVYQPEVPYAEVPPYPPPPGPPGPRGFAPGIYGGYPPE